MNNPLHLGILAGIMFIGPNSQALLSSASSYDMNNEGYHCISGQQVQTINIHYQINDIYNRVCSISRKKNIDKEIILWKNQRTASSCEAKAEAFALRLEDRGWSCRVAAI